MGFAPRWVLGKASLSRLETCDTRIEDIIIDAIACSPVDFTILEGHRTARRQRSLYEQGASKCDGVNKMSKHQTYPSLAIDVAPWPIDWQDTRRFHVLAGVIKAIAYQKSVKLVWGHDWDDDGDFTDQSFNDLPHFEIRE